MYVIKRTDQGGGYVADMRKSATGGSYTNKLQYARIFPTREAANADRCPENEIVLSVDDILQY